MKQTHHQWNRNSSREQQLFTQIPKTRANTLLVKCKIGQFYQLIILLLLLFTTKTYIVTAQGSESSLMRKNIKQKIPDTKTKDELFVPMYNLQHQLDFSYTRVSGELLLCEHMITTQKHHS